MNKRAFQDFGIAVGFVGLVLGTSVAVSHGNGEKVGIADPSDYQGRTLMTFVPCDRIEGFTWARSENGRSGGMVWKPGTLPLAVCKPESNGSNIPSLDL